MQFLSTPEGWLSPHQSYVIGSVTLPRHIHLLFTLRAPIKAGECQTRNSAL